MPFCSRISDFHRNFLSIAHWRRFNRYSVEDQRHVKFENHPSEFNRQNKTSYQYRTLQARFLRCNGNLEFSIG